MKSLDRYILYEQNKMTDMVNIFSNIISQIKTEFGDSLFSKSYLFFLKLLSFIMLFISFLNISIYSSKIIFVIFYKESFYLLGISFILVST